MLYCVTLCGVCFFFFKQKTAYEMCISDWSSDVCSSDLAGVAAGLDWKHLEAAPSGEPLLSALALTDGVRPVLMLDDVQTLPPDVLAFLARMVASAGGALTTIVAARGISQVPIDQTCLPGPLVEVTAADLSLSVQAATARSGEHTSEHQSLIPIPDAVF